MNEKSKMAVLSKLRGMFGTRAGKALAVKPIYNHLLKNYLRNNPFSFEGFRVYLNPEDTIITEMAVSGDYEKTEFALLRKLIRPGTNILDIGANIGLYTVFFAIETGTAGHVFAFEPEPANFSFLKKNIDLNGLKNVTASDLAVSSEAGEHTFFLNPLNKGDHRLFGDSAHSSTITVRMTTIDDFIEKHGGKKIDLVKMDIQGAEMQAIEGMRKTLSGPEGPVMMMEFWPYGLKLSGGDPEKTLSLLESFGFFFSTLDEGSGALEPGTPAEILEKAGYSKGREPRFEDYLNLVCFKTRNRLPQ